MYSELALPNALRKYSLPYRIAHRTGGDFSKRASGWVEVGSSPVGMIDEIIGIKFELETSSFGDRERLLELREICTV
jgi:hypothetical protein